MSTFNKLSNTRNPYQGTSKRVLCVCSAGLLRSPTIAWILSNPPFNFNTRAAGVSLEYALIPVTEELAYWADTIICVQENQVAQIERIAPESTKKIIVLPVEDKYPTRSPELIKILTPQLLEIFKGSLQE